MWMFPYRSVTLVPHAPEVDEVLGERNVLIHAVLWETAAKLVVNLGFNGESSRHRARIETLALVATLTSTFSAMDLSLCSTSFGERIWWTPCFQQLYSEAMAGATVVENGFFWQSNGFSLMWSGQAPVGFLNVSQTGNPRRGEWISCHSGSAELYWSEKRYHLILSWKWVK